MSAFIIGRAAGRSGARGRSFCCRVWISYALLLAAVLLPAVAGAQSNGVLREVWFNIGGSAVADLTNNAAFPSAPAFDEVATNGFETPTDVYESYGQRLRALLIPPASGTYYFLISSDDASQLFLSTNDLPTGKRLVARVDAWTSSRYYHVEGNQKSAAVPLIAGQRYYLEALMKEGGGGDNLAVTWQKPGESDPADGSAPIPNANLVPYGLGPPAFSVHPMNATVIEGGATNFSVQLARSLGASYQWVRNGTNVPGATQASLSLGPLRLTDSGSVLYCRAANALGASNSDPATLTVLADTLAPAISSALSFGTADALTVMFSELVDPVSAVAATNYTLNNGALVLSATLLPDGQTVVLRTTPLSQVNYIVSVSNVRDRAATSNIILPGSQRLIPMVYAPLDIALVVGTNEPAGPSSRRTGLAFMEIMYHPTNRPDGRNLEFVEIFNSNPWTEDLSGYRISGNADYLFPSGTTIGALGYRVIAANPADLQAAYGLPNVLGPLTNGTPGNTTNVLDNGGGTLRLRDELGSVLLEVTYDDESPWPAAADGAGHSLVLARPSLGEASPAAWAASDHVGGSPGTFDTPSANPRRTVLINEFLAHTDDPQTDFVELYNYGPAPVDLAGCVLTDDPQTNRFVIPAGTTIAARGFLSFTQQQLGFALSAEGETVLLKSPTGDRLLDVVRFGAQENGVATGRSPDGARDFHRLMKATPGTANAGLRVSDIVINEVMYHPVSEDDDEEFIELFNRGTNTVDLGQWRLRGGVGFNFASGTSLAPGGFLVVARDRTNLLARHPALAAAAVAGDYSGKLGNGGDTVTLQMPDDLVSTNSSGQRVTNKLHIVVDSVTYNTGGRWGNWSDGGGSSLELTDPRSDKRFAPNWADSDEAARSDWTTVEFTGLLDNGAMVNADQLQLFLLGAGECLVDNVEVIPQGGANVVANSTFESGLTGWYVQGTHDASYWETNTGYTSSRCLHVVASDRGDTGANRIRTALTQTLSSGSIATLRAKVKWLKGHPEILLRLHGNWLEAAGATLTTANLGTPGARNSRFSTNAGPAITEVTHSPVLPAPSQLVTVTARVQDVDGLASVVLRYRTDPESSRTTVPMTYRGAGMFSAVLPGKAANTMVAFQIEAVDLGSPMATTRFPADAPARECLIRWGESTPAGNFASYRLWVTQTNVTRWATREKNSNKALDGTFVLGNYRVIYNVGTLYSGSPWHAPGFSSPDGNLCDYEVNFPPDDWLLGTDDFVLETVGNLNSDPTYQAEQMAFWLCRKLGTPYMNRRYIRMFFNGQQRANLYEDAQQPNRQVVRQWFPEDDSGNLHKIEDWFEFNDSGDSFYGNVDATLQDFTTAGGLKKTARYRWNFRPRAVRESASDFTNLFTLVDAMNATQPEPYRTRVADLVDVDRFMRVLAVNRIVGNWDSYGYARGKNMFIYKPGNGLWLLLPWDIDFVLNVGGNSVTDPLFGSNEPVLDSFRAFPEFQRAYWRAMEDAVNGPLVPANLNPRLDARYTALNAAGVGPDSPQGIKDYAAQRRSYILSQLAGVAAAFSVTGPANFTTNRNLLTLTGTAPIGVKTILVNGEVVPVTWAGVTNWSLRYALAAGTNTLTFSGLDQRGLVLTNATAALTIRYTGTIESPADKLVINEIMYHPVIPDAEFVELHNTSVSNAFDLSGWRIHGADCDIPVGTIIEPGAFLVFARNKALFSATYGGSIPVAGEFDGKLDSGGETLRLVRPGAVEDETMDQVTYDDAPPWPLAADGVGASLQLIDPAQDNNRVANWAAQPPGQSNPPLTLITFTNTWRYQETTNLDGVNWMAPAFGDSAWPTGRALLYVEEAALPEPKNTPLTLGRITYYFRTRFNFTGNPASTSLKLRAVLDDGAVVYLNGTEVLRLRLADGQVSYSTVTTSFIGDANYEGPFTLPAASLVSGENVLAVEVHQTSTGSSDIVFGCELTTDGTTPVATYTPGAANSVRATLPAFPPLWLNEVLPQNPAGITDRFGDRDPWVELYYTGTNALSLGGFYLTDNYSNLTKWPFPAAATVTNRQHPIVWLDGEPGESITSELHTSFRAATNEGSVALCWSNNGVVRVLDHLNYSVASAGRSFGDYPDGNVSGRQLFTITTPAATNNPSGAPLTVFINEWVADNLAGLTDPADGDHEDWFELYNPSDAPADLAGYFLTDTLTNRTKYQVPSGYVVPAHGYLLVWADGEDAQNAPGRDLHAGFSLSKSGEAVGLYGAGGVLIDAVTFGAQTTDQANGRFPDGSASVIVLTNPTPGSANLLAQPNTPPVLEPVPSQTVFEGSLLTFTAVAQDSNWPPQALSFGLGSNAPAGAAVNPTNGVFAWIPSEAQGPGSYSLTLTVADNGSPPMSNSLSFTVQVNESNNPPVLAPFGSRTVGENSLLLVLATASDADQPPQRLTFSLDSGAQPGLSINATNGTLVWLPNEAQGPGTYPVTVRVTDDGEPPMSATQPLVINVQEVNVGPVLAPVANVTNHVGSTIAFTASATDADVPANRVVFSLDGAVPPGATVDPATGAFLWMPALAGTNTFTVRATDDGFPSLSDTHSFVVVVVERPLIIGHERLGTGLLALTWTAIPGAAYRVQSAAELGGAWADVGGLVNATSWTASATNVVPPGDTRFWRIRLGP